MNTETIFGVIYMTTIILGTLFLNILVWKSYSGYSDLVGLIGLAIITLSLYAFLFAGSVGWIK
jgi:hypothetical protein